VRLLYCWIDQEPLPSYQEDLLNVSNWIGLDLNVF